MGRGDYERLTPQAVDQLHVTTPSSRHERTILLGLAQPV
jgi:hypothetical protein